MIGDLLGTGISESSLEELRAGLAGDLICPGDGDYDAARMVFNAMIEKRPALIARCTGVADVIRAVNFARSHELLVSVRGGGHNVAGNAVCDGGVVIDLSRMKGVRVDPAARTIRAGPGVTWGEFDRESQLFGLATTGGAISTTGIAGLTLGGGIGWLGRKLGLTCDNLLSVDLVTADGRFLTVSASQHADLFWGVRGGGGNFGVVTSFEFRLHLVGRVLAGLLIYPMAKARDVLRLDREVSAAAPDELSVYAALATSPAGDPVVLLIPFYTGPPEEGERLLRPLREFGPPLVDGVALVPYTQHQCALDEGNPYGLLHHYWKSSFLTGLSDEAIETLIEQFRGVPSPRSALFIEHLGGAYGRMDTGETAFAHRAAPYNLLVLGRWQGAASSEENVAWVRTAWKALQPFASEAVYVNYLEAEHEGAARVAAAFGSNYDRLVQLKNWYDPTNFFRQNQNIGPG